MDHLLPLIHQLSDGRFHSGAELAARFGLSRTAIWKKIRQIESLPGMKIDAVKGRGYRFREPLELLDEQLLLAELDVVHRDRLQAIHILPETSSTNLYVTELPEPPVGKGAACLAEYQSAGRGRRGRQWRSTFGRNLYLSLVWHFDLPMSGLAGSSLATGVVLAEALDAHGLQGHGLKWPNDLHLDGRKLAGILVEAFGEVNGPSRAVIGIGLNMRLAPADGETIDQPWTDLHENMDAVPSRNRFAGDLLRRLVEACDLYQQRGLAPFIERWRSYDHYVGERVRLNMPNREIEGHYVGLHESGALLLEIDGSHQLFHSGEVSLRRSHG